MIIKGKRITTNFYINADKEEAWINRRAQEGWALTSMRIGGLYTEFQRCTPGEYEYRIELLKFKKNTPECREYLDFVSDMGIRCIYCKLGIAYFRKEADGKPFELYTDHTSKIRNLKNRRMILNYTAILFFICAVLILGLGIWVLIQKAIFLVMPFLGSLFYLLLSGFLFLGARPYSRKIKQLEKEADQSGEVKLDVPGKKESKIYPFLGALIGFTCAGAAIGLLLGFFMGQFS